MKMCSYSSNHASIQHFNIKMTVLLTPNILMNMILIAEKFLKLVKMYMKLKCVCLCACAFVSIIYYGILLLLLLINSLPPFHIDKIPLTCMNLTWSLVDGICWVGRACTRWTCTSIYTKKNVKTLNRFFFWIYTCNTKSGKNGNGDCCLRAKFHRHIEYNICSWIKHIYSQFVRIQR